MIRRSPNPETGATFSDCEKYRYTLWRSWGVGDLANFIMLNPSTADESTNDPTVERCERRAREYGFGGLIVTNLFAWRSTDPKQLNKVLDPIGRENNDAIKETAAQCKIVVCAWGKDGTIMARNESVLKMLREFCPEKLRYLKLTKDGHPYHPLYVPYSMKPVLFDPN